MRIAALTVLTCLLLAGPALAQTPAPEAPAPMAPGTGVNAPVPIIIGTRVVITMREPFGSVSVKERAAVVQSRINQVLMHHPNLKPADVKVVKEGNTPVIYWGPFTIVAADEAHARANNFSSADLLAQAWANNMREAVKEWMAGKELPARALYRNARDSDFVYRRTEVILDKPSDLHNTKYIFSPDDFVWGAGVKEAAQKGFAVFVKKDAGMPPATIYLGNAAGSFTEYVLVRPEDETP